MVFLMSAYVNGTIGSVFLNHAYLISLKVYKSDKGDNGKILAITVKYDADIRTEACFETIEIPVKAIFDNVDIIARVMIGINKVPPKSVDAVDIDEILGDMLNK